MRKTPKPVGRSSDGKTAVFGSIAQIILALAAISTIISNVYLSLRAEKRNSVRALVENAVPTFRSAGDDGLHHIAVTTQNVGEKTVRGCETNIQDVTEDLLPLRFLPLAIERGGLTWQVGPGESHTEQIDLGPFRESDYGRSLVYFEIWTECVTDKATTQSYFFTVDLSTGKSTYVPRWRLRPVRKELRPWPVLLKDQRQGCPAEWIKSCRLDPILPVPP